MADWLENLEKKRLEGRKTFELEVISTGYEEIDSALGVKGIPRGKIVEIAGHPSVGKTALILDIVAQAQAKGLNAIYMDLDHKFDKQFAMNRAVKCDELLIFRPDPMKPENTIAALKQLLCDGLIDLVVFDSISMYKEGIEKVLAETSKILAGTKITIILASQIRNNFEDPRDYNTPFMKVLNQYCNIRIMLKKMETLKHKDIMIGKRVEVNIYKNVMAHPKSTDIEIYV